MMRTLRIKFVAILMTIVTILLFIIFGTLYYTTKINYRQGSMDSLRFALMESPGATGRGSNEIAPPVKEEKKPPMLIRRKESLPILVAEVDTSGSIKIVKNRLPDSVSAEIGLLIQLVNDQKTRSGTIPEWNLRYLTEKKGPDQAVRYAFADTYAEQSALHSQLIHSVTIGVCAFAAFFLVCILLSQWVARPVEEAWNRQRQFVADASHELKTPLTVILSNASMLSRSPEISDTKNRRRIEHIQAESTRMKQLIESLLFLVRSDSENGRSEYQDVDFSLIVNTGAMTFEPLFYDAGKKLSCQINGGLHTSGDEQKLRRLTDILLDNACKYSRDNSTVSLSLTASGPKEILLLVTSEGPPLTKEEQKQIFLRFYRTNPSRSGPPGYGLGLAIASDIAAEHHGKIGVQSDGSGRNTFSVRLPSLGHKMVK